MYKKEILGIRFIVMLRLSFALLLFVLSPVGANSVWAGQQQPSETYIAHVASFKNESNAGNFKILLEQKGVKSWLKKLTVLGKGEFYRVYVGTYESREAALSALQKLKEEKVISFFAIERENKAALPENIKNVPKAAGEREIDPKPESLLKKPEVPTGPVPASQKKISEKTPPEQEMKGPPREPAGANRGSGQDRKVLVPDPAEAIPDTPEEPEGE
ncbi:Sporulation related domain-containing protein [Syntrophus gentianae]|uniref:Sporulation related domain-containing protein n=1 Tax=Syntrophus gentianae TaxID=43775 RepID=A0A1H7XN32_9BACT|nr:SPOR domain-containing protein [Syntrophus gentianae]SEM35151.1 Sporulation related domain-containing protein [Syntrophus gentianae]